jgi:PAS domain S-box-containing protein
MTRILIVDDKAENLYYLEALLTGNGNTVECAPHGAAALVLARQRPPDIVVSDLLMPVMDGFTLLRHWKADPRFKQIPFIVYTATYTEEEDAHLAKSLGADAFILKPAEPEDFMAQLQAALSRAAQVTPVLRPALGDEKELLKVYSESLIRKLEEKMLQLETLNRTLQQDISERQAAEERLRESEERFRATFEHAAVGIAHLDLQGRFLRVNDQLCEITGYSRAELLEHTCIDLMVPEDREGGEEVRRAMLDRTQRVHSAETRYYRKNGRLFWGSVVTTLLRDQAGAPQYFISVVADVTERKVLQEQFLRAQRMESIGTLAGGIAHDLNNLLGPIVLGIGMLKEDVSDPAARRVIDMMEHSAQRGASLVKQVLSFARGVEGSRVDVHLGNLVHEVREFVRSSFPKNIIFKSMVPRETWLVHCDPTQINQILLNLCINARDAMPEGGTLSITTRNATFGASNGVGASPVPPGNYVVIEVTDTGIGMAPDVQTRVFEAFFTTKPLGRGTGLGLSTVRTIVQGHGGHVSVESEPGRGSLFRIWLPAQSELPASSAAVDAVEAPAVRGQGELILVVDDDSAMLSITQETLTTFGYRVLAAEDGAQAIALYAMHREEIAAAMVDLVMPVMDGRTLIAALRRINPTVKVIVTSGLNGEADTAAAGARHFLTKPASTCTMLKLVHQVVTEPAAAAASN